MQKQIQELERDEKGNVIMTKENLKIICLKDELYEYPELNTKLFLSFQGFAKLQNLEQYINIRVLYLENNFITKIENLEKLIQLQHLFLPNNMITKIEGLECNTLLSTLNLSNNSISKIENISHLTVLNNLNLKTNALKDIADIEHLQETSRISNIDISDNTLEYNEGLIEIFKSMKELKCLYLKNNPCVREFKNFRRLFIGNMPQLTYFDTRNVTEQERLLAVAWVEGGEEKMKQLQQQFINEKNEQKQKQFEESRLESLQKRKLRIRFFEKEIKKSIILVQKYQKYLPSAKATQDEQTYNYYFELIEKENKNITEMDELLKDMIKQVQGITQQLENGSQRNAQQTDKSEQQNIPDLETKQIEQKYDFNDKNQPEPLEFLDISDQEIDEILTFLVEKNPFYKDDILQEFQQIINELSSKLNKKVKFLNKSEITLLIQQKMATAQQNYQKQKNKDEEFLNELD